MNPTRRHFIRSLFDAYITMYASRDERLTSHFSAHFSGYTGGGDFIVGDTGEWIAITRHDFSQVPGQIRIEMLDLLLQDLSEQVVMATALFHIHLPIPEPTLSREAVRLTLVFRQEGDSWKIAHSGISVPYHLVQPGEVYPIQGLYERNHELERLLKERTQALAEATRKLDALNQASHLVRAYLEPRLEMDPDIETTAAALHYSRRTLTRHLKEENTTFQQIKDRVRYTAAMQLLANSTLSIHAIAAKIGFTHPTTFHRAFKKWTGTTPLAYQRTEKQDPSEPLTKNHAAV